MDGDNTICSHYRREVTKLDRYHIGGYGLLLGFQSEHISIYQILQNVFEDIAFSGRMSKEPVITAIVGVIHLSCFIRLPDFRQLQLVVLSKQLE